MADQETTAAMTTTKTGSPVFITGAAPEAASTTTGDKKVRKIIRKKRRPARVQVDPATFKSEPPPQTGVTYNIWYNKWSGGDRESSQASQTHAKGRCNIARDAGYTRADSLPGSFFCLAFARGLCYKGSDCSYLHRLPVLTDMFNPNNDCFGRDKFSGYRDDMGGVGSFMRTNRTIYIGRIHVSDDIEEIVSRHFAEWGQVERIRVLNTRGVAFVTYSTEANAEFAKEAMAHQSLDHDEILNVRWATEDPNPMAKAREARRVEEQAAAAVRALLPADYIAELEGRNPDYRKRRRIEGGYGLDGYEVPDSVWYSKSRPGVDDSSGKEMEYLAASGEEPRLQESGMGTSHRQEEMKASGIFSSSTLATLQKQREKNAGLVFKTEKETKAASALVNYSSDGEDDN